MALIAQPRPLSFPVAKGAAHRSKPSYPAVIRRFIFIFCFSFSLYPGLLRLKLKLLKALHKSSKTATDRTDRHITNHNFMLLWLPFLLRTPAAMLRPQLKQLCTIIMLSLCLLPLPQFAVHRSFVHIKNLHFRSALLNLRLFLHVENVTRLVSVSL